MVLLPRRLAPVTVSRRDRSLEVPKRSARDSPRPPVRAPDDMPFRRARQDATTAPSFGGPYHGDVFPVMSLQRPGLNCTSLRWPPPRSCPMQVGRRLKLSQLSGKAELPLHLWPTRIPAAGPGRNPAAGQPARQAVSCYWRPPPGRPGRGSQPAAQPQGGGPGRTESRFRVGLSTVNGAAFKLLLRVSRSARAALRLQVASVTVLT